jgi:NADH:ubiquinone oxidoreductase subunit E
MNMQKDLPFLVETGDAVEEQPHKWVAVCMGTGCTSSASAELRQALSEELDNYDLSEHVEVRRTGCFGFCEQGPIMVVHPEGTFYTQVKPRDV